MQDKKVAEICRRLLSVGEEAFDTQIEFGEYLVSETEIDLDPKTVIKKLRQGSTIRLREILEISEALELDLRWVMHGEAASWDLMPTETVIVGLGKYGIIEFQIPAGWPDLDLRYRPGAEPMKISAQTEGGE